MNKVFFVTGDNMITPETVSLLRAKYPDLINMFSEYQFIFANKISETDFEKGDRLIVFDDTQYTLLSLAKVYAIINTPLIVIVNAKTHEVVVEEIS